MAKHKICLRNYICDRCIFKTDETKKENVLKLIANKLLELEFVKDKDAANLVYEKLIEREKLGSTGIIKHIAIPHCKVDEITNEMVLLVTFSNQGIDFDSHDGEKVHIIFTVFTKKDKITLHLGALAAISRMISKHSISSKIQNFLSEEKLRELVEECEYEI